MDKLYRSKSNRILFGVCGGIAEYLKVDATWIRLALVLITLSNYGTAAIAYVIAAIIIPENPSEKTSRNSKHQLEEFADDVKVKLKETVKTADKTMKNHHTEKPRILLGLILVFIGIVALTTKFLPEFNILRLWPVLIIIIGLSVIAKRP
ncbi:hypothetical protein AUK11_01730 [bacterium CG2_30_37_16]|nr:MAG: hypothetical protein AUK11_01730 [bacterium CG2_30_37_16]